ncbi:hypothetical protein [Staphylococcus kloosii]|uniref:hypothetical protein n=1 Tax=Staphylococcus kloosii TaxID=29384 RepID=UPI0018A03720|nr:hypothetical protein [Staphylococcus kloosii]MBF7025954.1 hypothetical protein [Staphylococcus kloosii]
MKKLLTLLLAGTLSLGALTGCGKEEEPKNPKDKAKYHIKKSVEDSGKLSSIKYTDVNGETNVVVEVKYDDSQTENLVAGNIKEDTPEIVRDIKKSGVKYDNIIVNSYWGDEQALHAEFDKDKAKQVAKVVNENRPHAVGEEMGQYTNNMDVGMDFQSKIK